MVEILYIGGTGPSTIRLTLAEVSGWLAEKYGQAALKNGAITILAIR